MRRLRIFDFGLWIDRPSNGEFARGRSNPQFAIRNPKWLLGRRGDLVWNTLVVITVLLPLAGLAIDVPRYFTLRTRLQLAADAAAEAAARSMDIPHFRNTGEVRLSGDAYGAAGAEFARATGDLAARGYAPALGAIQVDEGGDTVTVHASGTTQIFFALSPSFTVPVVAQSRFRMDQR